MLSPGTDFTHLSCFARLHRRAGFDISNSAPALIAPSGKINTFWSPVLLIEFAGFVHFPSLTYRATSSQRVLLSVFWHISQKYLCTVPLAVPSRAAIASSRIPWAQSSRHSMSRGESASRTGTPAPLGFLGPESQRFVSPGPLITESSSIPQTRGLGLLSVR